jgi:hypothetical protein
MLFCYTIAGKAIFKRQLQIINFVLSIYFVSLILSSKQITTLGPINAENLCEMRFL